MRPLAFLILLAGCGGADAMVDWRGTMETLPNGAVRVTNPAEGLWQAGAGWRLVPERSLGALDGEEAFTFAVIIALEADDQGRLYVLDRAANELRIFSPEGEHVRTVGRPGDGPGEYRAANGLLWLGPDTLLVVDHRGARYSLLNRDGDFVRAVTRSLPFSGWVFSGGVAHGTIYELTSVEDAVERRPVLVGTPLREGQDLSTPRDTIPLPQARAPAVEPFVVRSGSGVMMIAVPFAPGAFHVLDRTGTLWHGHTATYRLVRTTLAGDTLLDVVMQARPAPVLQSEIAEWEEDGGVRQFKEMGGDLDLSRIPRVKPFLEGVYLDPEDYLWISLPSGPDTAAFAVLDSAGRYLGRLAVGGVRREVYVPPVVRNGRLYLAGSDALGVPKVFVFRIER